MLNLPNSLSLLRASLALLFIVDNVVLRCVVILLAMLTDSVDGYLARRYRYTSKLGALLDPIMDKFFVYVVLSVLVFESQMEMWQAATMLTRDCFLFVFMLYLGITGNWRTFQLRSIRWGKVTTASQFCILLLLVLKFPFPSFLYFFFVLFGCLAFIELIQFARRPAQ